MSDKARLLAAGRIKAITRGPVSKADREWLNANPDKSAPSVGAKPTSAAKVVADVAPAIWPVGTKAHALDGSGTAGPNECCGTCGVHYRWCQCHMRLTPRAPRVIVAGEYRDVRLEAPD
jgi:hypothetical protein